ncbi:Protein CBG21375 [Caenorhabditis briggsae]|uniref:Uncharacterized protein n=2 Tax=Caenorhabditis briggsae TaxID=6238 RepID=A0AAE9EEQ6_CAEBR|nr:Protein CBG21375 [Caenorhabditis briggsae]UMM20045.1 hypothetical protein L5515_015414 [Caenorhabditis briggsae]CAP38201.1 Protein CBG21375 [Caenorhabditis briggsae]
MDNIEHRERVEALQHDFLWQDAMFREMEYRKEKTNSEIEKRIEWHENELKKVRIEREEKVNYGIWYAAELKQRLEIMERVQQKQKTEFEKIKKNGDVVIAENVNLERAIARKKDELRFAKRETEEINRKRIDVAN